MKIVNLIILALTLLNFSTSYTAQIIKTKKTKLMLQLDPSEVDQVKKGSIFYIISPKGKKIGIAMVVKAKGNKALARLRKGKARKNLMAELKGSQKIATASSSSTNEIYGGLQFGITSNILSTDVNSVPIEISGNGLALKAFYDYPILEDIWIRAEAGYQQFLAEDDCAGCLVDIAYFTARATVRYMISKRTLRPWVGGFISSMVPVSDNSTAIENVSTSSNYGVALGLDYILNDKWMLPFSIDYGLFPEGKNTNSTTLSVMGGLGMKF